MQTVSVWVATINNATAYMANAADGKHAVNNYQSQSAVFNRIQVNQL